MKDEEFYRQCADLLGTTYDCQGFPYPYRTRWNNRSPGHGRFPGYGIIRLHGDRVQIALRNPFSANRCVEGRKAALDWISDQLKQHV